KGRYDDILLIGEDMDVVDYKLAKCCTPIPGDDVFGFVTVSEGIKIHRTTCPNAAELLANHNNRMVKAKWTSQHEVAFLTGLKIKGTDRVGLINDVSKINQTHPVGSLDFQAGKKGNLMLRCPFCFNHPVAMVS